MARACCCLIFLSSWIEPAPAQPVAPLPNTKPLDETGDLATRMLDDIHRSLERKTDEAIGARQPRRRRDPRSPAAYEQSVRPNRDRLRTILGVVDERLPVVMERFGGDGRLALAAEMPRYRVCSPPGWRSAAS